MSSKTLLNSEAINFLETNQCNKETELRIIYWTARQKKKTNCERITYFVKTYYTFIFKNSMQKFHFNAYLLTVIILILLTISQNNANIF